MISLVNGKELNRYHTKGPIQAISISDDGKYAAGIEVPMDCQCSLPEGYETAELEPCTMLYFQSEPYEDEQDFCQAIESTYGAIEKYESQRYGYDFAYDLAPSFNFGAEAATGAKIAVPAKKL